MVQQKLFLNQSQLERVTCSRSAATEVGQWDQDAVLLTVQMISTVQIFAGVCGSGFGWRVQQLLLIMIQMMMMIIIIASE